MCTNIETAHRKPISKCCVYMQDLYSIFYILHIDFRIYLFVVDPVGFCFCFDYSVIQSNESEKRRQQKRQIQNHHDNIVWSRIAFTFCSVRKMDFVPCSKALVMMILIILSNASSYFVHYVKITNFLCLEKRQMHCMYPWHSNRDFFFLLLFLLLQSICVITAAESYFWWFLL